MITNLDTISWSSELATGNAEFLVVTSGFGSDFGHSFGGGEAIYVVSNVRNVGGFGVNFGNSFGSGYSFEVLQSAPVPPSPGPGASFTTVGTYAFPQPNTTFDPVACYDTTKTNPVIHIIGMRDNPSSQRLTDLIKFTYDTVAQTLTGPVVLSSGARIRSAYDIAILPNGNYVVAASLAEPALTTASITNVALTSNTLTVTVSGLSTAMTQGQWLLLNGLSNATFLNGQLVQVLTSTLTSFTAHFVAPNYTLAADTGTAAQVGDSVLVQERVGSTDALVPGSAIILDSSPARTGNAFDGVSLVINGSNVELYYQSHPKVVTFADQNFTINLFNRISSVWDATPTLIFSYSARYSDNRLTIIRDANNNRYLSQTYWFQSNHPEGVTGNVLVGYKPALGAWSFHPTFGDTVGGSFVQNTLSIAQNGNVSLIYLLQPFTAVSNPPTPITPAYTLKVASVALPTLGLTDVPGFYNTQNFTWLRGTKAQVDNSSAWAVVGEREVLTNVTGELHTVPLVPGPYQIQVSNSTKYFQNTQVVYYPSLVPLVEVATAPQRGQYTVEEGTGVYAFNVSDQGAQIAVSYSYVSAIQPAYASLFNIPPVARISPTTATVWRGGTFYATDVAPVTNVALTSNVVTITAANDFVAGQQVAIYELTTATFLNGHTLSVASANSTSFTANFTHANYASAADSGSAAVLIPGALQLSTAASTDADADAMQFIWSENNPDTTDVTLATSSAFTTVTVADAFGPTNGNFDAGVAVIDVFPDLVTQRHPALLVSHLTVSANVATLTYTAPSGAIVPIGAQQVMPYQLALAPPVAPTCGSTAVGTLSAQYLAVAVTYLNASGETAGSPVTLVSVPANNLLTVTSPASFGSSDVASSYNVYFGNGATITATAVSSGTLTVTASNSFSVGQTVTLGGTAEPALNGLAVVVLTASSTQFTATVTNIANYTNASDTGTALAPVTLQTLSPVALGTNYTEPVGGQIASSTLPPTSSTALQQYINDKVLTLTVGSPNLVAPFTHANISVPLTGKAISEKQFAVSHLHIPANVAPNPSLSVFFPTPPWYPANPGTATITATTIHNNVLTVTANNNFVQSQTVQLTGTGETFLNGRIVTVLSATPTSFTASFFNANYTNASDSGTVTPTNLYPFVNVARNTKITLTPTPNPAHPLTEFPIVYTGITDPDDKPTYTWAQVSGTPVTTSGLTGSSLSINTNGVSINGEPLVFSLTLNDGVNTPVVYTCTINVASYNFGNLIDTHQLARSLWSQSAVVTNIAISSGVGTVTASNNFVPGQPVRFVNLTSATFLNNVLGLFVHTATPTQFTFVTTLPNYPSAADTGTAYATTPLSMRNTAQGWTPLDISVIYSDLDSIKRTSVLDGSDRYIVISPYSVLVYGVFQSANPVAVLMRKLVTPSHTRILDAVHTEQDYTLVLDDQGNLYRYSTAPLITTDNPDTTVLLSNVTSMTFADPDLDNDVHIFTTQSFANSRIVVLSGEQGAVLLQLNTATLAVNSTLEFSTADNLLYGANNVQFVRWVNMGNLRTGRVFIGTVQYASAQVSSIQWASNTLTVTCANSFTVGTQVTLSGLTATANSMSLNGMTFTVVGVDPHGASFTASMDTNALGLPSSYGPTADTGLAESQTSGTTWETLIDLSQGQIIGTWDKSKLRNQFVETGEILFTPDTTYGGSPIPPVLFQPIASVIQGQTFVTITWQQERPDLINTYTVSYAPQQQVVATVPTSAPYTVQIPVAFSFTADAGVKDTSKSISITGLSVTSNVLTVFGNNGFNPGDNVLIGGATGLVGLINSTLTVVSASPTQFTANFTTPNYGHTVAVSLVQVLSNILTVTTAAPHTFVIGSQVTFAGLTSATWLNGQTVTITGVTGTTFTAAFTHGSYGPSFDTGNVIDADTGIGTVTLNTSLVSVTAAPQAGQYNVNPSGVYTFNAAQAGHIVTISFRQSFNTLQQVNSGATQTIVALLAAGQTYYFEVQAFGADGASGQSNIQSITI